MEKRILFWNQVRFTVPMDRGNNAATISTADGFGRFDLYCKQCKAMNLAKMS